MFEKYVPRCLEKIKNSFKTITPIPENSMVQVNNRHAYSVSLSLPLYLHGQQIGMKSIFLSHSDPLHFARLPSNTRRYSIGLSAGAL